MQFHRVLCSFALKRHQSNYYATILQQIQGTSLTHELRLWPSACCCCCIIPEQSDLTSWHIFLFSLSFSQTLRTRAYQVLLYLFFHAYDAWVKCQSADLWWKTIIFTINMKLKGSFFCIFWCFNLVTSSPVLSEDVEEQNLEVKSQPSVQVQGSKFLLINTYLTGGPTA